MKKIMFVGAVGSGKTTLTQRLLGENTDYRKTQAVEYHPYIIDTPGEFVQQRQMYSALNVTSVEAEVIGLLLAADETRQIFAPSFSTMFSKPCIGIITKLDLDLPAEKIKQVENSLKTAGVREIFYISASTDEGLQKLKEYLTEN